MRPYGGELAFGQLAGNNCPFVVSEMRAHSGALIGGAMARIGVPSGKSLERPELDVETLERNAVGIRETIGRIFRNNNDGGFVVLNNYDWWKDMRLVEFLKRVGTMMGKESVKKRLESEQGMSYAESTNQLLQGYDLCICLIRRVFWFKSAGLISGGIKRQELILYERYRRGIWFNISPFIEDCANSPQSRRKQSESIDGEISD